MIDTQANHAHARAMSLVRTLLMMSLSVVSCCCEGDECTDEDATSAANDSSAPPTGDDGPATEGPATTSEPMTTETETDAEMSETSGTGSTSGDTTDASTSTSSSDSDSDNEPKCGNGVVEGDEECDEPPLSETGACLPGCKLNVCGDGFVHGDVEDCDLGPQNGQYGTMCTELCETGGEFCGDEVVQPNYEDCEPGDIHDEFDIECQACAWGPYRVVFVSSLRFDGAMNNELLDNDNKVGLKRADLHCQQLAEEAMLEGTFYAWLSDNSGIENHSNAADRIGGPDTSESFRMRNGGVVATSWEDLVANGPSKPIVKTEYGVDIEEIPSGVWSNTKKSGLTLGSKDCEGWTADSILSSGSTGKTVEGELWTDVNQDFHCKMQFHIYCFQGSDTP